MATGYQRITIALGLMPFAGIAYLWFIGVVRDKLGDYEDRFFSSVFFGSSLLFLGMVFVAMAIVGGLVAGYRLNSGMTMDSQVIYFSRAFMIQLSNVYALRMAGVTMISLATIWIRTGLAPRWLVLVTYTLALILLSGGQFQPVGDADLPRLGIFNQPVHPVAALQASGSTEPGVRIDQSDV